MDDKIKKKPMEHDAALRSSILFFLDKLLFDKRSIKLLLLHDSFWVTSTFVFVFHLIFYFIQKLFICLFGLF